MRDPADERVQVPREAVEGWGAGSLKSLDWHSTFICYRLVLEQDNCVTISGIWSHGHGHRGRKHSMALLSCQRDGNQSGH